MTDRERYNSMGGTPTKLSYKGRGKRTPTQIDVLKIDDSDARKTLKDFFAAMKTETKSASDSMRKMWMLGVEYSGRYADEAIEDIERIDKERQRNHTREMTRIRLEIRDANEREKALASERRRYYTDRVGYERQILEIRDQASKFDEKALELRGKYAKTSIGKRVGRSMDIAKGLRDEIESIYKKTEKGDLSEQDIQTIVQDTEKLGDISKGVSRIVDRHEKAVEEIKDTIKTTVKAIVSNLTHNLVDGIRGYFSMYERTFTDFAGRMQTSYNETRDFYSSIRQAIYDTGMQNSLNITEDLIPSVQRAISKGFTGNDALAKGIADAQAKVIMPWLDTQSDAWVNLTFNLSKQNMELLKSQQLQLQATKSGNRLLQTGVIDNLTSEMEPILRNIDFNTGGAKNLSSEAQAMMSALVDSGMSANEAYSQVLDAINAQKDVYGALTSGDVRKILLGEAAANGGGIFDQFNNISRLYGIASNSDRIGASALNNILGLGLSYGSADEARRWMNALNNKENFLYKGNGNEWDELINGIDEFTTVTRRFQNAEQNASTYVGGHLITATPEGDRWFDTMLNLVKGILSALAGGGIADLLINKFSTLFSGAGGAAGSSGSGGLFSRLLQGAGSGAKTAGKFLASNATRIGGIGMLAYGGYNSITELIEANKASNTADETKVHGISSALYGVGAAGGLAAAIAGGPIGLVIGGIALAGAEVYKAYNQTAGVLKELNNEFNAQKDILKQNNESLKDNVASIKESISSASTLEEKKSFLIEAGLATDEQLKSMTSASIENFLKSLDKASEDLLKSQQSALEQIQKATKEETDRNRKVNKEIIINDILNSTGEDQLAKLRALGYTDADIARLGRDNYGGFLGIGSHKMTVKDLLNDRTDNKGFLGIGGQSKLDAGKANLYDDYASIFGLDNYTSLAVDSDLMRQLAEAAGILETYRNSSVPSHKTAYNKAKELLKSYYGTYGTRIDAMLSSPLNAYAIGTPYMPNSQLAWLDEGERVLTKNENKAFNALNGVGLLAASSSLINRLVGIASTVSNDDDISREDMTNKLVNGLAKIQTTLENIQNSDGIDYNRRTLPRPLTSYSNSLVNLSPSI